MGRSNGLYLARINATLKAASVHFVLCSFCSRSCEPSCKMTSKTSGGRGGSRRAASGVVAQTETADVSEYHAALSKQKGEGRFSQYSPVTATKRTTIGSSASLGRASGRITHTSISLAGAWSVFPVSVFVLVSVHFSSSRSLCFASPS